MGTTEALRARVALAGQLAKARRPAAIIAAIMAVLGQRIAEFAHRLAAGEIDAATFVARVRVLLLESGTDAAAIAGLEDAAPLTALVGGRIDDRAAYLDTFAADLADGELSEDAASARSRLWAGLAWLAYQSAALAVARTTGRTTVAWRLEAGADHCDDCQALAEGSPYSVDELPTTPGAGDTSCLTNCRCELDFG